MKLKINEAKLQREMAKQALNHYATEVEKLTSEQVKFIIDGGMINLPPMKTFSASKAIFDIEP